MSWLRWLVLSVFMVLVGVGTGTVLVQFSSVKLDKDISELSLERSRLVFEVKADFDEMIRTIDSISSMSKANKYCWDFKKYSAIKQFVGRVEEDQLSDVLSYVLKTKNIASDIAKASLYQAIEAGDTIDCGGGTELSMIEEIFKEGQENSFSDPLVRVAYLRIWQAQFKVAVENMERIPALRNDFHTWLNEYVSQAVSKGFSVEELGVEEFLQVPKRPSKGDRIA